jgi:hypothetical protein
MNGWPRPILIATLAACVWSLPAAAADTVATAVYARIGNGYKRAKAKDGTFKPEYYALSNGGRIFGTGADITVDCVTYPQVAEIAMKLLAQQNYHYAQSKEQAKLLVVLQWGNTIASNGTDYQLSVTQAASAYTDLVSVIGPQGMGSVERGVDGPLGGSSVDGSPVTSAGADPSVIERFEMAMLKLLTDNRARDQVNELNAKVLGYVDELADSNDIRRWAGGGDRYNDLIADVEEARYYIVISAYDFPELLKSQKRKLLWQVRVSVRAPGNSFDDSVAAMLKGAAKYFGQDSGRIVRGEEAKGTVELGDLKFLGEVKPAADKAGVEGPKK